MSQAGMHVEWLKVQNFRSIEVEEFPLEPLSVLVGKNNAGKSNVLRALQLLLEATSKDFSEQDFHEKSKAIVLEARLHGVEPFLVLSDDKHRPRIEEDLEDGHLLLRRVIEPGPRVGKLEVLDVESKQYKLKTGIDAALKQFIPEVIYIEAFQDPSEEAVGKTSATLGKVLKQIMGRIEEHVAGDMAAALAEANKLLNVVEVIGRDGSVREEDDRADEVKRVERRVREYMCEVFGDTGVRIVVGLPRVPDVVANTSVELRDVGGVWTSPDRKGQGVQRVMYSALLRTLADEIREQTEGPIKRPFVLLIEEPEIFLHPSLQGVMRESLEELSQSNQVIYATHSPTMVSACRLPNVVLVRKVLSEGKKGRTCRLRGKAELIGEGKERRLRELLAYQRSSRFLFADSVAVVEGPSDVALLEAMVERITGRDADAHNLALIDSGGKDASVEFRDLLVGMGLKAICMFDVDYLWRGAGGALKSGGYTQFVTDVKRRAVEEGLAVEDGEWRLQDGAKERLAMLIDAEMRQKRDLILADLRGAGVWVLRAGEIEHYAGLSRAKKGEYVEAAGDIRAGTRAIVDAMEIEEVLRDGLGLVWK